jgi:hypothetical protein
LDSIKVGLKTWIDSDDFTLWKIEFIWQMREFKNKLLKHFELEEDSGFFDHFPVSDRNSSPFGKKIKAEHKHISKELDKVILNLKKVKDINHPGLKIVESKILNLITELHSHEHVEMSVIHSIYNPDDDTKFI